MHALAQLVHHQHAGSFDCKEVLLRCLTVDMLPTIMEGMADTRSKSLPSLLDVVNYVLLQSTGMRRLAKGGEGGEGGGGGGEGLEGGANTAQQDRHHHQQQVPRPLLLRLRPRLLPRPLLP